MVKRGIVRAVASTLLLLTQVIVPSNALAADDGTWAFPVGSAESGAGWYVTIGLGDSWTSSSGISYRGHLAEDWFKASGSSLGEPVYAAAAGRVVVLRQNCGNYVDVVVIEHDVEGELVYSLYGHLEADGYVVEGQEVQKRQQIGVIGDPVVFFPHIHFSILNRTAFLEGPHSNCTQPNGRYVASGYSGISNDYDASLDYYDPSNDVIVSNRFYHPTRFIETYASSPPPGDNVALNTINWSASSIFSSDFGGAESYDGIVSQDSKWTSDGSSAESWLALDLGADYDVTGFLVRHAGAGGEQSYYNTEAYRLESGSSLSGPWVTLAAVNNGAQENATTTVLASAQTTRYVRLYIIDAGIDNYARIPELEVYGTAASPPPNGAPTAMATATPSSGVAPLAVSFDGTGSSDPDGDVLSFSWSFGDGNAATGSTVSHNYATAGTYTATLTVDDGNGGSDVASVSISVDADSPPEPEPVLAVDISFWSGNLTDGDVACWESNGIEHVVAGTQVAEITIQQLETAVNGGLTVDAYVVLYWDADITQQVQTALAMIQGYPVGRLWLDVEVNPGGLTSGQLEALIQEGVDACGVFPCGIYTGKWWWDSYMNGSTAFSSVPLWYAYYDQIPSLDTWPSQNFGGWPSPSAKQYSIGYACGVTVDFNVMHVNSSSGTGTDPGEVGTVTVNQASKSTWTTVNLMNSYANPVVVMQPASFNGSHPTTIRIRNVTESSFEFQMDEWDYLDGAHTTETLGYLVMEAGAYQLQDGTLVEAGTFDVNHNFGAVLFSQSFYETPVILSQVLTFNGASAAVTRQRNASPSGFEVKVQEEEANDGAHAVETVGYIAIEPSVGTTADLAYEAQRTPDAVNHSWYTIGFLQSYSDPVFLATLQSYDGRDTAGLRYTQLGTDSVDVFVEEETSRDSDLAHTTEVVGYIAFDHPGALSVVGPPFAPTGLSPEDGATITTSSVTLSCNAIADASQYDFEISYWNGSTWQYYYTYSPTTNSQTFWPSVPGTAYQWRVRAQNAYGWGDWSAWVNFDFN